MTISLHIDGLKQPSVEARRSAAEALARLGEEAAPAALDLCRSSGDEDDEVRDWAVAALEGLGAPTADRRDDLVALLASENANIAYWAATLLGRLKDEAAAATAGLAEALQRHGASEVRQRAAWALGQIGPAAATAKPALQAAAGADDPRLARLATQALREIETAPRS